MDVKKIIDDKLEEWLLIAGLLFMVLLVVAQIISRYLINFDISWSVELSRFLLIWISWISVSYATKKNSHIRAELLRDKLPDKFQKIIDFIVLTLSFIFSLFLITYGTKFALEVKQTGQTATSLDMSMWIIYLAVPIAGFLMSIRFLQQVKNILKN